MPLHQAPTAVRTMLAITATLALAVSLLATAPAAAQPGTAGSWPVEAADGNSSNQARTNGPDDPGVRWHVDLTALSSTLSPEGFAATMRPPILSPTGDVLVVLRPDEVSVTDPNSVLVALDPDNGEPVWEVGDVDGRCGPVVDSQGRIWISRLDADDPALEAVDVDGQLIPGTRLDDVLTCAGSSETHISMIGGSPEHLIILAGRFGDDALAAYDVSGATPTETWRAQEGDGFGTLLYGPANAGLGVPHPVIVDDAIYLLTDTVDNDAVQLSAFELADGTVRESLELRMDVIDGPDDQTPFDLREWHPVVVDDLLVFAIRERSGTGRDYDPRGYLAAVDLTTGLDALAWKVPTGVGEEFGNGAERLTAGDGVVIARPGGHDRLVGFDPTDGSQTWVGDAMQFGSAGFLSHVADARGASYASANVPGTTRTGPARFGPTGQLEWRVDPDALNAVIGLEDDDRLGGNLRYGPIDDGVLYALREGNNRFSLTAIDNSGGLVDAARPQPGDPGVSRVDGGGTGDPTITSIEICDFLVEDGTADAVALARVDDFADALAGSALPVDCILFTEGGPDATLDVDTRADIRRALGAEGTVYVLGGINAISGAASAAVQQDGYLVRRLEGPTRYETAEAVAAEVGVLLGGQSPQQVIVAFGGDWADAITVGAYAHATTTPIVLTTTETLHPAAERVIDAATTATPGTEVILVGGQFVISPAVEAAVPNPRRVAGSNRMATAVAIAEDLWPGVPATGADFVLANLERSEAWTIALASAPLAATISGPQLGLRVDSYPVETQTYLEGLGLTDLPSVVLLGDVGFISDDVATSVEGSVTPP